MIALPLKHGFAKFSSTREYTRVDEIIDLVFSTAEDILEETPEELAGEDGSEDTPSGRDPKEREKPVSFNLACVDKIGKFFNADLTKQSRVVFGDLDSGLTITCAVSKEYKNSSGPGYWFAFQQHQLEKLSEASSAYACFGCGSPEQIAVLPLEFIKSQLEGMNQTIREDGRLYWHVQIHREAEKWVMHRRKEYEWPEITSMMLLGVEGAT
ncbi:hypothetical protein BM449_00880 [Synechococcus sp. SynAce01]|nr:hypothetical protein BM449_00880 [Synechococcus sp. SynAce01]